MGTIEPNATMKVLLSLLKLLSLESCSIQKEMMNRLQNKRSLWDLSNEELFDLLVKLESICRRRTGFSCTWKQCQDPKRGTPSAPRNWKNWPLEQRMLDFSHCIQTGHSETTRCLESVYLLKITPNHPCRIASDPSKGV